MTIEHFFPWAEEGRRGRHIEPAGVGHRVAFVPLHPDLPEVPDGYCTALRLRPNTSRLEAFVGLRAGQPKVLSIHAAGSDARAFYCRLHPSNEGPWMRDLAVTEVVSLGAFDVAGGSVLAGDVVEIHRALRVRRSVPLVVEAKRVCRAGRRFGLARSGLLVAPVCRVEAEVELYLAVELDEHGCLAHAALEAV